MARKPDPTFVKDTVRKSSKIDQKLIAELLAENSQDDKQMDKLFKELTEISKEKVREIGSNTDWKSSPLKPFDAKKIAEKTIF